MPDRPNPFDRFTGLTRFAREYKDTGLMCPFPKCSFKCLRDQRMQQHLVAYHPDHPTEKVSAHWRAPWEKRTTP